VNIVIVISIIYLFTLHFVLLFFWSSSLAAREIHLKGE